MDPEQLAASTPFIYESRFWKDFAISAQELRPGFDRRDLGDAAARLKACRAIYEP